MGDGGVEGLSAIGDGGQAAVSLTPDIDGTHICIFERSQLEGSYVGDLLYRMRRHNHQARLQSTWQARSHAFSP